MDHIITANDYSLAEGADGTVKGRILKMVEDFRIRRNITITVKDLNSPKGNMTTARIWQGQWIAECPTCKSASFVSPSEPIFFCFGCANRANDGSVMPVYFPKTKDRVAIEKLLLERPVDDNSGLTELERVGLSKPLVFVELPDGSFKGLSRNWDPSETVKDIISQNKAIEAWRKRQ